MTLRGSLHRYTARLPGLRGLFYLRGVMGRGEAEELGTVWKLRPFSKSERYR